MSARRGVASAALLAAWLLAPGAATAQPAPEATPAAAAPSPSPPATPTDAPSSLVDIGARAEELAARLRDLDESLTDADEFGALEAEVGASAQRTATYWAETAHRLSHKLRPRELDSLESAWHAQRRHLEGLADEVEVRVRQRELDRETLAKLRESWTLTRDLAQRAQAPAAVVDRVEAALAAIDATAPGVERRRDRVLALDDAVSRSIQTCDDALDRMASSRRKALARLFREREAPLWSLPAPGLAGPASAPEVVVVDRESLAIYATTYWPNLALTLGLAGFLILLFWRGRSRLEGGAAPARTALRTPVASALLVTIGLTTPLRPDLPVLLQTGVLVVVVLATLVALRRILADRERPALYALAALVVLNLLRVFVLQAARGLDQLLLIAEMAAAAALLAWGAGRLRRSGAASSIASLGLRVAALACALAGGAAVAGFLALADFLGTGVLGLSFLAVALFTFRIAAGDLIELTVRAGAISRLRAIGRHRALVAHRLGTLVSLLAVGIWLRVALDYFGLLGPAREWLTGVLGARLHVGELELGLGHVLGFVVVAAGAYLVTRLLVFVLDADVYSRMALPRGVPYALSTLTRYVLLATGFLLALGTLGLDLTRVALMVSALGLGIGFGLQNVINNFVSGLILLFERPIQVGDTVQKGTLIGEVQRIGIRSSTVRTWDGAEVVVPNANLVSEEVVNWTLSDRNRRIDVEVGVAYGNDLERVLEVLGGAVANHPEVLANPAPQALFKGFGESSLDFVLRVWTAHPQRGMQVQSAVGVAIGAALRDAGIAIPFPQRDLHLVSVDPDAAARLGGEAPPRK